MATKFKKTVVEKLTQDNKEQIATRNEGKAIAAVSVQIAKLNGKKVDDTTKLEDAKLRLEDYKYPITAISDTEAYINGIKYAEADVTKAEEELEKTEHSIKYWEELLAEFKTEVE